MLFVSVIVGIAVFGCSANGVEDIGGTGAMLRRGLAPGEDPRELHYEDSASEPFTVFPPDVTANFFPSEGEEVASFEWLADNSSYIAVFDRTLLIAQMRGQHRPRSRLCVLTIVIS